MPQSVGCDKNRRKYIEGENFAEILFLYFKFIFFGITVLKIKGFAVFRSFQVISMRFAIFLCYSVRFFNLALNNAVTAR